MRFSTRGLSLTLGAAAVLGIGGLSAAAFADDAAPTPKPSPAVTAPTATEPTAEPVPSPSGEATAPEPSDPAASPAPVTGQKPTASPAPVTGYQDPTPAPSAKVTVTKAPPKPAVTPETPAATRAPGKPAVTPETPTATRAPQKPAVTPSRSR
ncbi:hypothetical protein GCM10010112_51610 [Actinoplanes lobatus]|uniref:Cytoskeletal protein RodZ n=1 Tax=Actinoplanes lobatus TaxID=113568 RepID=A0A7W7MGM2_9ACTN|nr:hypothetical protein [Actinoplanes lobatus]MBB4749567.1 cytoskeletal protein RodZ [Actinoplanes lobatus]GGN78036.1 hypothetical protein GCM10010112_51610 [Actinoplanes lobatus]GIE38305.1 hypothetical protein Alo02nite_12030 [Actinoplanes lobatus]